MCLISPLLVYLLPRYTDVLWELHNNNNKISHRIGEHYFTDKSVLTQFPLSTINT